MTSHKTLAEALGQGQRRALARAITLIESSRADHQTQAEHLLEQLLPHTGNSIRLGISGVPGVGKSTFIETFGLYAIEQGRQVAVLSIDPSSALSGGSILGDKTRMEQLARHPQAYIRPSPAGRTLGGVARRTREAMLLCEAAGFDLIIVETVGVGQSETAVADMTDLFLLLLLPGGGDDLQGIKRGIMELADLILVNKADGDLLPAARRAATDFSHALRMMQPRSKYWQPQIKLCSALENQGIDDAWQSVLDYCEQLSKVGEFERQRQNQAKAWLWQELREGLLNAFSSHAEIRQVLPEIEQAVATRETSAPVAARQLLARFLAKGFEVNSSK